MTELVDESRERMGRRIFAEWPQRDVGDLVRSMRKLENDIQDDTQNRPPADEQRRGIDVIDAPA